MVKEAIYEYFENERLRREKWNKDIERDFNIAPSYLTDCIRKIYYKKTNIGESNPIELHSYIKFELGNVVHEMLGQILQRVMYIKRGEVWLNKELYNFKWIYKIDNYLLLNTDEYIIEIKSIYSNNARKDIPKEKDVIQLFCYMLLERINRGILLYINRDTGYIEEFHFNIEGLKEKYGEKYKYRLKLLQKLKDNIDNKIIPNREYNIYLKNNKGEIKYKFQKDKIDYKTDYQCSYCQYKDLCWQDVLEEIKNYNFYINKEFV